MKRRSFIAGLLGAAAVGTARAQPGKVYRIAIVSPATPVVELTETGGLRFWRAFFEELRRLGYVEGQNLVVERYSGEGRTERYPELAREVVQRSPDLISVSTDGLTLLFKASTTTIPIVSLAIDPIAQGIVPNLAHPGGNITGVSSDPGSEVWGKRLELLQQAVPGVSRVGWLATRERWDSPRGAAVRAAAQRLGLSLLGPPLEGTVREPEFRRVFAVMAQQGAEALAVDNGSENFANRRLIVDLAQKGRLPSMYAFREHVELGGLMAYAFDFPDTMRHSAAQVAAILGGAKAGDIPYYQGAKFELVINLQTAKALGLTVPSSLLAQADEVIE